MGKLNFRDFVLRAKFAKIWCGRKKYVSHYWSEDVIRTILPKAKARPRSQVPRPRPQTH